MQNQERVSTTEIMVDKSCKVRELALKILHKAWRAWFDCVEDDASQNALSKPKWQNHVEFRAQLVAVVQRITDTYP